MSEPLTWAAVGMAAVANMGTWLMIIKSGRNEHKKNPGNNPGSAPGLAKVCIERGEKMAKMELEQDYLKEDILEIKGDLKEIKRAVVRQ